MDHEFVLEASRHGGLAISYCSVLGLILLSYLYRETFKGDD